MVLGAWHGHPAHDSPRPPPWKPVPPARSYHDATIVPKGIGTVSVSRCRMPPRGGRTSRHAPGDETPCDEAPGDVIRTNISEYLPFP